MPEYSFLQSLAQLSVGINLGFGALVLLTNADDVSSEEAKISNLEATIQRCAANPKLSYQKNKLSNIQLEINSVRHRLAGAANTGQFATSIFVRILTFILAAAAFIMLIIFSIFPDKRAHGWEVILVISLNLPTFILGALILKSIYIIRAGCAGRLRQIDMKLAKIIAGG